MCDRVEGSKFLKAVMVIAVLGLLVAACQSEDDGGNEAAANGAVDDGTTEQADPEVLLDGLERVMADDEYEIGYTLPQFRDPFWVGVAYGIEAEAEAVGVDVVRALEAGSYVNVDEQVSQIEDLTQLGVDGILAAPVDRAALAPVIDRASDRGITVVGSGNLADSPGMNPGVTFSHEEVGEDAAHFIAQELGGEGSVAMLNGPEGADWAILRHNSFTEVMDEEYPDIEIIDDQWSNVDRAEGQTITEDWTQRFGDDLDAIFASVNLLGEGSVLALRAAGLNGDVVVATSASTPDSLEMLEAGDMHWIAQERAILVGRWAVNYAVRVLNGEDPDELPNIEPAEGDEPLPERVVYVPNDRYTAATLEDLDPYLYEFAPDGWVPGDPVE